MTYDLYGWKQAADCSRSADEILDGLIPGGHVSGVEDFPVAAWVEKIRAAFPDVKEEQAPDKETPVTLDWSPPSDGGFYIEWENRFLVTIQWFNRSLEDDPIATLIDIADDLGCTLYDPQIDDYLTGDDT